MIAHHPLDPDLRKLYSGSIMRLRTKSPYSSVLISYMKPVQVEDDSVVKTAAVDGTYLYINKKYFMELTAAQRDGLLCHEMLHCALGHCWRCGSRIPEVWNVAADLVVNLIVRDGAKMELPPGGWIDDKYKTFTVEEVYSMLWSNKGFVEKVIASGFGNDIIRGGGSIEKLEEYWNIAKQTAAAISRMAGTDHGDLGLITKMEQPQVAWRTLLWDEMSFAPSDFNALDRRFIGDEVYVEDLQPEETLLDVGVYLDTSGSVVDIIGKFTAEVKSICSMFPNVHLDIYWIDTELIGPFPIDEIDRPRGGGGTDFRPAFVESEKREHRTIIYLTDGFGAFPEVAPAARTIWCVSPGGLATEKFPFGQVARILD